MYKVRSYLSSLWWPKVHAVTSMLSLAFQKRLDKVISYHTSAGLTTLQKQILNSTIKQMPYLTGERTGFPCAPISLSIVHEFIHWTQLHQQGDLPGDLQAPTRTQLLPASHHQPQPQGEAPVLPESAATNSGPWWSPFRADSRTPVCQVAFGEGGL